MMHKSLHVCIVQDDKISESTSSGSSKIAARKHQGKEGERKKRKERRKEGGEK